MPVPGIRIAAYESQKEPNSVKAKHHILFS
jgi:hypothetical protein